MPSEDQLTARYKPCVRTQGLLQLSAATPAYLRCTQVSVDVLFARLHEVYHKTITSFVTYRFS